MGTLINAGLIVVGGVIGLFFKKRMSQALSQSLSVVLGVAIVLFALANTVVEMMTIEAGGLVSKNGLILIVSLTLGMVIGSVLKLQDHVEHFENYLVRRFHKSQLTKGFMEASLLYCVGAMAIIGSFADGMSGDSSILITKGIMDGISALILVTTLGPGVIFSFIPVLLYQGSLTLLAYFMAPAISAEFLSLFSLVGFSIVFCIGLNLLKLTQIKIVNLLPALLIPILYLAIQNLF